jgi:glycosyltransferase involved in cell wall biosynthesis
LKKLIRITTVPISLDKLLGKQLTFMSQYYDVTAISSDKNELERVARKYGVQDFHVEMTREISPVRDILAVIKLYGYLRKAKPEIVHSHTPKAGIVGMMAAWLAGVPHRFHTVAGLPLLEAAGIKRKILNLVERLTYQFATKVYPNSFGLKDIILEEKFCLPEKLKVLGQGSSNGIDTRHFMVEQISISEREQLRTALEINSHDFLFIFVGRLVGDKGINELVHAFKEINLPKTKLLLVGPLETYLDPLSPDTIKEIECNSAILNVGYQDDVRPYFSIADALVFPSYREGFPNVVLQAGAMELPAIVSNINGCNEIIINGENGLIIPAKNADELKDAMLKLLNNTELFNKLKKNARPQIVENYEQSVVWQAILEEYKKAEQDV